MFTQQMFYNLFVLMAILVVAASFPNSPTGKPMEKAMDVEIEMQSPGMKRPLSPTLEADMCTGYFVETDRNETRAPVGTKCVFPCENVSGRWGTSFCYTDDKKTQWGAECIPCNRFTGWKLYAEKHECGGAEIDKGTTKDVDECAAKCKDVASMFIFGTNDYGKTRCSSDGCACYCETSATKKGFCKRVPHDGYRLYKYNPDCSQGDWPEIQACCTNQLPCDEGQGDCDDDSECKGDLVCGQNNCDRSKFPHFNTDCCTAAPTTTTQSTTTTTSTTTPTTTTTSTTTPTTTSTSTTTHTATTTTTASSGTLWQETAKDKECYNFKETASVSNQVECQEHCLADTACAGILYSYKDRNTHHCYTCSSPVLPYSRSNNNFGFYKRPGCVDDNMAGSCEVAINANPHFCQEDFYRLHCRSSCNLCGKVCDDTIPADHFDAGNVKKSGCPKSPGSTCIISKADEQGDVAFKCNHGKWVLADDGYEKITDAWCWPWEGEFQSLTKAKSQCNDDSSCAMIYGSVTFHLCGADSDMKGSGTGNAVYFKKKKN